MNRKLLMFAFIPILILAACASQKTPTGEPTLFTSENEGHQSVNSEIPPQLTSSVDMPISPKPLESGPLPPTGKLTAIPTEQAPKIIRPTPANVYIATPVGGPFQLAAFDQARRDLSARLAIPLKEITYLNAEEVTWRDAALGCPQPGMFYAQVLSPGYLLQLEAGGQVYTYHTDLRDIAIWCEKGEEPLPGIPIVPGEIDDGKPWVPVE